MATGDYEREGMVASMTAEELRTYNIGMCHAYADVFDAFEYAAAENRDVAAVFARINAQWDDVRVAIVRGVA